MDFICWHIVHSRQSKFAFKWSLEPKRRHHLIPRSSAKNDAVLSSNGIFLAFTDLKLLHCNDFAWNLAFGWETGCGDCFSFFRLSAFLYHDTRKATSHHNAASFEWMRANWLIRLACIIGKNKIKVYSSRKSDVNLNFISFPRGGSR